jgi:hypothetical protein
LPLLPVLIRCKYFNRYYFVKDTHLLSTLLPVALESS